MVALLDFEKAFDRVDHSYLLQVLRHYGFPTAFVDMVRVIYSGRRSNILVNGHLSSSFHIKRGVLQGDPLSPLLFVLALEPMCQLLRQHPHFGIRTSHRVHTGSFFADDSQLYAGNERCLHRQLALVQSFCDVSGFRLNVDKTQILTFATVSTALASWTVTQDQPAKSLGILVAPDLPLVARFNYVFDKFVARLSLWRYKARTLTGKVVILQAICLPVMWYQLSFVPADKSLARKIDQVMLQFIHGEDINPFSTSTGFRLIKKALVFESKERGGLGLCQSYDRWRQHNRAVAIRCVKAFATPTSVSKIPSWILPGYCLIERAFHPWGSPRDLLLASGTSSFFKQLVKNPNVTPMWSTILSCWFELRWTPFGFPTCSQSLDIPLWHNSFLPGLENLYDQCSASTQPQALSLASLKITKLSHVLTPCQRVWPASILFEKIKAACVQTNIPPPSKLWISRLVAKLTLSYDCIPEADAPVFQLPSLGTSFYRVSWMVQCSDGPILLTKATSKAAKLSPPEVATDALIPTKHLNLPSNFYADPNRLRQVSAMYRPVHILPRYGEFIYKTLLRAHAMQYLFQFRDPPPCCIFCGANETFQHFLFSCRFGQAVWHHFKAIQRLLDCPFPTNAVEMFFELPKPPDGYYIRGYLKIWPIIRACVYYQIWLHRADRTFRPDLPTKTPTQTAIQAAHLIKLHLQQLLGDLPIKKGYSKVFNLLYKLCADDWLKTFVIPTAVSSIR